MNESIPRAEHSLTEELRELRRSAEQTAMVVRSLRERFREYAARKERAKARRRFDVFYATYINPPSESEQRGVSGVIA